MEIMFLCPLGKSKQSLKVIAWPNDSLTKVVIIAIAITLAPQLTLITTSHFSRVLLLARS